MCNVRIYFVYDQDEGYVRPKQKRIYVMSCLNGQRLRAADLFRPDFIAKRKVFLHFNTHSNTSAREQLLIIKSSPSMAVCTGRELRALSGRENKRDNSQEPVNNKLDPISVVPKQCWPRNCKRNGRQ